MSTYLLSLLYLEYIYDQRQDLSSYVRLKHEGRYNNSEIKSYVKKERVLLINMLLVWTILYPVFKKCLEQYLRNKRIALVNRKRYANVAWSLIFNAINIFYMIFLWNTSLKRNIMEIMIKSFYIHYSGIIIYVDKNWYQGFLNLFLTFSVFGIKNNSLKLIAIEVLTVHAIHLLIFDIFRISYLKYFSKNKEFEKAHPRFPYLYYLLVWSLLCLAHTLLHVLSVPFNHLYLRNEELFFPAVLIELRLIFLFLVLMKNVIYPQSWKRWLFSNPSSESLYLRNLLNNFKNRRSTAEKTSLKKQIWQTLVCTMVMKKKINRIKDKKLKDAKAEN